MAALLLPVLFGVAALVVDVARLLVYRAEIQAAMDACALAAVSALDGSPSSLSTAQARAVATLDISKASVSGARDARTINRLHFQSDQFQLADLTMDFSAQSAGPWSTANGGATPATARYARCMYNDRNNGLFLVPVLKLVSPSLPDVLDVSGTAVAGLRNSQSTCVMPMALCKGKPNPGNAALDKYGLSIGQRITTVATSQRPRTGNFGWLDFTPPSGGAPELEELMKASGSCSVVRDQSVGQSGRLASLDEVWNARFGIYNNQLKPENVPPDFSGYSYPSDTGKPKQGWYSVHAARPRVEGYNGTAPRSPAYAATVAQHGQFGQQRRLLTAALIDCDEWDKQGGGNPKVLDFACVFFLAPVKDGTRVPDGDVDMSVEYLGLASEPGAPCTSNGLSGGIYGPPVPTLVQ
jgi:hypothetical protein